ncbi:hypothetical protein SISNIDRAFT_489125 [Sistotremastrum niveocremeum HHB9708]|uniref:G-protein coupled receptors family 1 profile domain-containing protein n=1 Tax=Sistotremastrum niveocremeum HHB9708 TaxID=1314777 RepID=A0A164Q8Y6_9AGAM|nr:hypothetical protein SISNIDRAFT_489125 [Sistotremastrum niveocremeum HHB9708]
MSSFYTGQYEADTVRREVCAAQAILKHGVDPAAVSALFLFSVEASLNSWRLAVRETVDLISSGPWLILTLAIPYVHFVAYSTITAVLVNANPQNAYRNPNSFYCTLRNPTFGIIQGAELNALVLVALIFQVKTGLLYWKRRKAVGKYKPTAESSVNLSTFIRLAVFTLWQLIGYEIAHQKSVPDLSSDDLSRLISNAGSFGSELWSLVTVRHAIMSVIAASIPFVVFLVFSTQKDIMLKWCFWKAMESPRNRGTEAHRVGNPATYGPKHDDIVVSISSASAYKSRGTREPEVSPA